MLPWIYCILITASLTHSYRKALMNLVCDNQLGFKWICHCQILIFRSLCQCIAFAQQMLRWDICWYLPSSSFSFFSPLPTRGTTPKGDEPGIWLPLTLNKQLLSDSHGCTVVLRDTRWEITQEMEAGWGMDEEVGEQENGNFSGTRQGRQRVET